MKLARVGVIAAAILAMGDANVPGLDRRGQHADGGNHQRARHTEAGLQEVVVNELPVTSFQ
jgi:hypothetical protein